MNFKLFFVYIIAVWVGVSCVKAPDYSDIPEIQLIEIRKPTTIMKPGDSLVVVFSFKDGDGDLGKLNSADTIPNLFITDKRFSLVDSLSYSIPNIPKKGTVDDVSGRIDINLLAKVYCNPLFPGRDQDTLSFEFQVRDRSGNYSNKITSEPVILYCQ
ncbi:MAG: hypothetical protein M9958_10480 [Chitinophagales bacterium]|nr:hypothetical protein [Chitinophagales bacterium]